MNIFCTRKIAQCGISLLEAAGHTVTNWEKEPLPTTEELISICKEQDALVIADGNRIKADFLKACPHLKIVAVHSVGYNHVDVLAAKKLGIPVSNTPGAGSKEVADTAFFLMLAASKKAFFNHQRIRHSQWKHFEPAENLGINLRGKALGIFGLGAIGFEMARLCRVAYDMPVLYFNRHRNLKAEKTLAARYVSFDELLAKSDVLSLHAPLTAETKGLFHKGVFDKMKRASLLINTSRGGLIDETDLIAALRNGEIWGAGLDVCNPEPMLPDNPLLDMPNVAVTPHIGNAIDTARNKMAMMVAENIIAAGKGEKLPNEIPELAAM